MYMRIFLIEVNVETDYIVFAPLVAGKSVNILCPILEVFTASDVRIVRAMFQINCLTPEGQTVRFISSFGSAIPRALSVSRILLGMLLVVLIG